MADVNAAIEYVLRLEDESLSGNITEIPGDAGGKTRFGISQTAHPDLGDFFTDMDRDSALALAKDIYAKEYAAPLHINVFYSQEMANVALAYAVNECPKIAIETLQRAANLILRFPAEDNEDGIMGPETLSRIHGCVGSALADKFRLLELAHYAKHAKDNVLRGLVRRALV